MKKTNSQRLTYSESSNWPDSHTKMVRDISLRNAQPTKMQTLLLKFTKMIGLSTATQRVEDSILRRHFRRFGKVIMTSTPSGQNHFKELYERRNQ